MSEHSFEPRIIAFLCNWCSYRAVDLAGTSRLRYAPNVRTVRAMCSGRVDPAFVLKAFALGADGVIVAGCHPGECHYLEQNAKTARRYSMLRHTLPRLGIEAERLRLVWASAAEAQRLAQAFDEMTEQVRELGPLDWWAGWDGAPDEQRAVEQIAAEHVTTLEAQP